MEWEEFYADKAGKLERNIYEGRRTMNRSEAYTKYKDAIFIVSIIAILFLFAYYESKLKQPLATAAGEEAEIEAIDLPVISVK